MQTHLLASISLLKDGDGQSDEISRVRYGRVWSTVSSLSPSQNMDVFTNLDTL